MAARSEIDPDSRGDVLTFARPRRPTTRSTWAAGSSCPESVRGRAPSSRRWSWPRQNAGRRRGPLPSWRRLPRESVLFMLLGQNLAGLGRHDEARAATSRRSSSTTALRARTRCSGTTTREGHYAKAREYSVSPAQGAEGRRPGAVSLRGHVHPSLRRQRREALKTLNGVRPEFRNATVRLASCPRSSSGTLSRVSTSRTAGPRAMKAYEKATSGPGSKLSREKKSGWAPHHGRAGPCSHGRSRAWKEAEPVAR